ncbi:hypothetical protein [Streptomyces malaysiensis]|uniref:hypothetical protein n=1 Tax=Streptomyces malaysiensis TaxID=92644 RepID=UPI0008532645|nr:hypothetical protein [Streptomyces sp. SPMA113]
MVTLGGVGVAGSVLVLDLAHWARTGRRLDILALLVSGLLLGTLAAMCGGGLLAWATARLAGPTNVVGGWVLGAGADQTLTAPPEAGMAVGGGVATTLLLALTCVVGRCCCAELRLHLVIGAGCGALLGLTAGMHAVAVRTLIPAVNTLGVHILNALY